MALGKNNKRIRNHMGDNGHLKFGDPAAWSQFGKSNKWSITYDLGGTESEMADKTIVNMQGTRKAMIEIEMAQTHPEEFALLDQLRLSETGIEFWGDADRIGTEDCEIYVPEAIITGVAKLETPASDNMRILVSLKVNPQSDIFQVQDVDLPSVSNHGGTPVDSNNEFFAYYVAVPD